MSETSTMHKHYSPAFDYIRLLLALAVVFQHFAHAAGISYRPVILPVPVFVSISGFMIFSSLERSTGAAFWIKRAARVMPAFLVSLGLVALLFGTSRIAPTLSSWLSVGLHNAPGSVNGPLWSLAAEEMLYVALFIAFTLGKISARTAALLVITGAVIAAICPSEFRIQAILLPCFSLGVLFNREPRLTLPPLWACVAVSTGLAFCDWRDAQARSTLCALLQCWGFLSLGKGVCVKKLPIDISYGLYVYHAPLIAFFAGLEAGPLAALLALTLIPLCLLSCRYIEGPANRAARTMTRPEPRLLPLRSCYQPES